MKTKQTMLAFTIAVAAIVVGIAVTTQRNAENLAGTKRGGVAIVPGFFGYPDIVQVSGDGGLKMLELEDVIMKSDGSLALKQHEIQPTASSAASTR